MTRTLIGTLLTGAALVLAGPLHAQSKVVWQNFQSAEGRFKIAFPGEPVTKSGKYRTATGDIPSTQYTAGDGAEATYDVRYSDYPASVMAKLTPAKLLDAVRDGLVAKGKLASEKPFGMGKVAGREQEIVGEDGTHYRVRLLLVESRLYQLTAMAKPPARADAERFFGSFQLTGMAQR